MAATRTLVGEAGERRLAPLPPTTTACCRLELLRRRGCTPGTGVMARSHIASAVTIASNLLWLWRCAEWWPVGGEMKKVKMGRG